MAIWTYRCYEDGKGTSNLWQRWYDATPGFQGKHDAVFGIIEQQPVWDDPGYTKVIGGVVVEVRMRGSPKWRVWGYYGEARREFVVTQVAWHKDKKYGPDKDPIATTKVRKKQVEQGMANAPVCRRPS